MKLGLEYHLFGHLDRGNFSIGWAVGLRLSADPRKPYRIEEPAAFFFPPSLAVLQTAE